MINEDIAPTRKVASEEEARFKGKARREGEDK
jgi:hypothetical protein